MQFCWRSSSAQDVIAKVPRARPRETLSMQKYMNKDKRQSSNYHIRFSKRYHQGTEWPLHGGYPSREPQKWIWEPPWGGQKGTTVTFERGLHSKKRKKILQITKYWIFSQFRALQGASLFGFWSSTHLSLFSFFLRSLLFSDKDFAYCSELLHGKMT